MRRNNPFLPAKWVASKKSRSWPHGKWHNKIFTPFRGIRFFASLLLLSGDFRPARNPAHFSSCAFFFTSKCLWLDTRHKNPSIRRYTIGMVSGHSFRRDVLDNIFLCRYWVWMEFGLSTLDALRAHGGRVKSGIKCQTTTKNNTQTTLLLGTLSRSTECHSAGY